MTNIKIGICGLGTVGSGVFNVMQRNLADINARASNQLSISLVGCRRDNANCDLSSTSITRDIFDVAKSSDVDIVVELIGGTTVAYDLVMTAIEQGKHVVTANKALIAEHGMEIFARAEAQGVMVGYEASVAGGIPIIKALREGLSANRVKWLAGIINGTTNFILSEMDSKGRQFSDVLVEAQEKGYAEADPTFDVEGIDASHKLAILASIAFAMPVSTEDLYTDGITQLDPQDVAYARELGYAIKHLGIARQTTEGIELRVHPTLVPEVSLIAGVNDVLNAVMVNADAVGTTLFYGPGAGAEPTASAVIADVVDIARSMSSLSETWVPALGRDLNSLESQNVLPIEEVETSFYMRFSALDEPGVLSNITKIMGDSGISIEAIIQREQPAGEDYVNVIILTSVTKEKCLNEAVSHIEQLNTVRGSVSFIRVEHLDQM
ncbi:homoserine dehydrogenase [Porticoccaceae bacterium]|nr:homoserine dehydrogenase [Porticoccaceae bacterium]MDA8652102.1 homoserine dehydrogenase [Porticoccaceae bacterium]MDA8663826.1 homoserine dehydrogenase [Porticoccaceae bacterium]MDA8681698.1 homoserine dehydrogenase [Porticoccaceae bacterium]MDB2634990.1 homoserine dehydrogenase [Porticoccaceae bacterium]